MQICVCVCVDMMIDIWSAGLGQVNGVNVMNIFVLLLIKDEELWEVGVSLKHVQTCTNVQAHTHMHAYVIYIFCA